MRESFIVERMSNVHSDIRGPLFIEANRMRSEGIDVLRLNTGNPGSFDIGMPDSVKNALIKNLDMATPYCDVKGMTQARTAICDYHTKKKGFKDLTIDDIFIANGVSEASQLIMTSICESGDEVLLPSPSYSLWTNQVNIYGGKAVFYRCDENSNWFPDVNDIKNKINSKTKIIVLINPNNPTGSVYSKDVLNEIIDVARKNNLLIIADEIYDRLCMDDEKHYSVANLAPDMPVITCNGLSKSHIICGFRCGWITITGPKNIKDELRENIQKLAAMRLCPNTLSNLVIPAALEDNESTSKMFMPGGRFYDQREATCKALSEFSDFSFVKPKATFYIFPKFDAKKHNITSDKKFAMDCLHATNVLIIPGSGFDYPEANHFRICMLPKKETLYKAVSKIGEFLEKYQQN